jgi:cytochrome oxidase Cu insertion factor (SCO1/SenC/PrrC family)
VFYQRQPKAADGSYTVDHTAAMFLVDPRARLKAVFAHPPEPDTVIANYRRLAR